MSMSKRMRLWLQLPECMRQADRWLVSQPSTKRLLRGRADNPETWKDFKNATDIAHAYPDDISISFVAGDGWICADIDNHYTSGLVADWARQQLVLGHYAEYSINNGIHVWFQPDTVIQMPPSIRAEIWATRKHIICTGRKL